jgi:hypothetical protein
MQVGCVRMRAVHALCSEHVLQRSAVDFLRRACDVHSNCLVRVDIRGRGLTKVRERAVRL